MLNEISCLFAFGARCCNSFIVAFFHFRVICTFLFIFTILRIIRQLGTRWCLGCKRKTLFERLKPDDTFSEIKQQISVHQVPFWSLVQDSTQGLLFLPLEDFLFHICPSRWCIYRLRRNSRLPLVGITIEVLLACGKVSCLISSLRLHIGAFLPGKILNIQCVWWK